MSTNPRLDLTSTNPPLDLRAVTPENPLYTMDDLRLMLGGSTNISTIRRAIDRGHLRAYKIGHAVRITKADAEAWMFGAAVTPNDRDAA